MPIGRPLSVVGRWSQPVDATPGGQLAINTDDGVPNVRPNAFTTPLATSYPTTPFSLPPPFHYEVTDLSSYTLYLALIENKGDFLVGAPGRAIAEIAGAQ
jgi:hypothetical protein